MVYENKFSLKNIILPVIIRGFSAYPQSDIHLDKSIVMRVESYWDFVYVSKLMVFDKWKHSLNGRRIIQILTHIYKDVMGFLVQNLLFMTVASYRAFGAYEKRINHRKKNWCLRWLVIIVYLQIRFSRREYSTSHIDLIICETVAKICQSLKMLEVNCTKTHLVYKTYFNYTQLFTKGKNIYVECLIVLSLFLLQP